jgi:hypothetical protein
MDWRAAAADPAFNACQDGVADALYYGLAMQHAAQKGFKSALTRAAFYDAQWRMGDTSPTFGMKAMIAKADTLTGPIANPPNRVDEDIWLGNFLRVWAQSMYEASQIWRNNMFRVANYEKLRKAGNFDLTGCLSTGASPAAAWAGSGYPADPGPTAQVGTCP